MTRTNYQNPAQMRRAYKFLLRPTSRQARLLAECLEDHRQLGARAKAGLNRSIYDAGWGMFLRVLAAKAESAGRTTIAVDARRTSERCARCGHVAEGNRASQAVFRCLACGHEAHADVNAAINILGAGLALQRAEAA